MAKVSVVIATYQRPEMCERALISVLGQQPAPDEVFICDDGSADETRARFERWAGREHKLRYLRTARNTGTPAAARNLGLRAAQGDLVAFLDDDDQWLPGKLARQFELCREADVIATNAVRADGSRYFGSLTEVATPDRSAIVADNPIILSSALAPRRLLLGAGGFLEARWARGVEDYELWLRLADGGARFAVAPEPLVVYDDSGEDRLSAATLHQESMRARLAWRRLARAPLDPVLWRAALNRTVAVPRLVRARGAGGGAR